MRLSVFSPESSTQLFIDLAKIYQNHLPPEQLTPEALQALIENEQSQFYVTLFNERHLGALKVQVTEDQARLSLLSVREITRRRGIAKNLLREVEKQLKSEHVTSLKMALSEIQEAEKERLTLFMQAVGYQLTDGVFTKRL